MISHHHKCIFIHIPKNAGQSVEHAFLEMLGLSWDLRAPLLLRFNDRPELGPPRLAHLKASEYVRYNYLTQDMFDRYFKFAFVRNPWSRIVSIYKYSGYNKKLDFKTFLLGPFKDKLYDENRWFVGPQADFIYGDNGRLLVDYVGRFEDLQNGFDSVCKSIGVPSTRLPHVNQSKNIDQTPGKSYRSKLQRLLHARKLGTISGYKNWRDYYCKESIDCVSRLYEKDVELFEYNFQ